MHQTAVFSAIHRAVVRLLRDLAETPEGRARIEKLVREIMAELSGEGIRYVSANED